MTDPRRSRRPSDWLPGQPIDRDTRAFLAADRELRRAWTEPPPEAALARVCEFGGAQARAWVDTGGGAEVLPARTLLLARADAMRLDAGDGLMEHLRGIYTVGLGFGGERVRPERLAEQCGQLAVAHLATVAALVELRPLSELGGEHNDDGGWCLRVIGAAAELDEDSAEPTLHVMGALGTLEGGLGQRWEYEAVDPELAVMVLPGRLKAALMRNADLFCSLS